ncbi:hypothetical protein ACJX0J_032311 [Zea mays]
MSCLPSYVPFLPWGSLWDLFGLFAFIKPLQVAVINKLKILMAIVIPIQKIQLLVPEKLNCSQIAVGRDVWKVMHAELCFYFKPTKQEHVFFFRANVIISGQVFRMTLHSHLPAPLQYKFDAVLSHFSLSAWHGVNTFLVHGNEWQSLPFFFFFFFFVNGRRDATLHREPSCFYEMD